MRKKHLKENTDKKGQILKAAKKEFAEKGFDGARMVSIAEHAGVNQALLHYHFTNKENLYKEVLLDHNPFGADLLGKLNDFSEIHKLKPVEKLYIAIYLIVEMHFEALDTEYRKILYREMSEERDDFKVMVENFIIPRYQALENVIIEGVESGDFATSNPLLVVIFLNVFVMTYLSSKAQLEGSSMYERLYQGNYKEMFLDFLMTHTFKALRPDKKELKIPKISQKILDSVKKLVKEISSEEG